jgi:type I restriction enzyme M protein
MKYNLISNNGIDYLDKNLLHNLIIPLPPKIIQTKIVNIMDNAYKVKEEKEKRAEELLSSVDTYLLDALGIELPKTRKETTFSLDSSEVLGSRLDPFYYKSEFVELESVIKNSIYKNKRFRELISKIINGVEIRKYTNSGFRYLRVSDLDNIHGIVDKHQKFVDVDNVPSQIRLNLNSLLLSRSGSLGLVKAYDISMKNFILSSHIFKIVLENSISTKYIEYFLKTFLGQKQIKRYSNGGIIPEINQTSVKKILIPLPPLSIQNKIAEHIELIRDESTTLKQEAKKVLEEAKMEVEKIILGEETYDVKL